MPRSNLLVTLGLVVTVAYLAISMRAGFIAHDEGVLGQSAERVLAGETPHVDFDDLYTGGLSYLHAAAFGALGARSSSLRVVLLGFSVAFIAAYFFAARRIVPPVAAAAVTFGAAAWSLKNYFAGLPSWYNLFFATFGTLALLIDAGHRRQGRSPAAPLWLAGLMGGLSVLFKISGLYFVLAGLLYVLHDAQVSDHPEPTEGGSRPRFADACAWLAPAATFAVLLALIAQRLDPMDVLHFLLPGAAIATVPWMAMRRRPAERSPAPDAWFLRRAATFAFGAALPPLLFVAGYLAGHGTGALPALYRGVFVAPKLRFEYAQVPLPPPGSLILASPLLLLCLPAVQRRLSGRVGVAVLAVGLGAVLVLSASQPVVYQSVWAALRPLVPLFVALAIVRLLKAPRGDGVGGDDPAADRGRRLYLLAAVAAFTSLIQYPYAYAIYFFYAAPLLLLLMLEVGRRQPSTRPAWACLLAFMLLFAVLRLNGTDVRRYGVAYTPRGDTALLAPDRVNLWVPEVQKHGYEAIVELVRRQTSGSGDVWAGPDAPEIYFLTGKRNPGRGFYQFFDPDPEGDLLRLTAGSGIRLLVINRRPEFSPPLSPATFAVLAERFPDARDVGPMQVRWR